MMVIPTLSLLFTFILSIYSHSKVRPENIYNVSLPLDIKYSFLLSWKYLCEVVVDSCFCYGKHVVILCGKIPCFCCGKGKEDTLINLMKTVCYPRQPKVGASRHLLGGGCGDDGCSGGLWSSDESGKGQKVCLSRGEFLELEDIMAEYCESIGIKNVYLARPWSWPWLELDLCVVLIELDELRFDRWIIHFITSFAAYLFLGHPIKVIAMEVEIVFLEFGLNVIVSL